MHEIFLWKCYADYFKYIHFVKFTVFIHTFDEGMARKLAIRSLRREIGSMDYIHSLLIAEDDFDENTGDLDQQKSGQVGKQ